LSTYLPKAQKLGYALDPRANTANLDKANTIVQFFTLHNITFLYP
jgi:single-stranded DNA-specific DHH superfamily exonuclease